MLDVLLISKMSFNARKSVGEYPIKLGHCFFYETLLQTNVMTIEAKIIIRTEAYFKLKYTQTFSFRNSRDPKIAALPINIRIPQMG